MKIRSIVEHHSRAAAWITAVASAAYCVAEILSTRDAGRVLFSLTTAAWAFDAATHRCPKG